MESRCSEFVPIYYLLAGFYNKLHGIKVSYVFLLSSLNYWPLFSLNPLKTPVEARCEYFFTSVKNPGAHASIYSASAFEFYITVVKACSVWILISNQVLL